MYIGIDIGGTNARVAASKSVKKPTLFSRSEFKLAHEFESDFSKLIKAIKHVSSKTEAIGLGFPGTINKNKTMVHSANHNREWERKPFLDKLSTEFNCPVFMGNDAVVASQGVAHYEEKEFDEFAYVTWGTGIGGAMVKKEDNIIKSTKLNWNKYFKNWEAKCGGKKLEKKYSKSGDKLTESEWLEIMKDFREELAIFITETNADLIVFGGGISVKQKKRVLNLKTDKEMPDIHVSNLGENVGLYGALGLIKSHYKKLTTQ